MNRWTITLGLAAIVSLTDPLAAQGRGRGGNRAGNGNDGVPPGQRPPAGMCRVWIDGVPPGQQPPVTDCATAERNRPSNGRVLYGGGKSQGKGKYKSKHKGDDRYDREDDRRDRRDRDDDRYEGRDRDHDRDRDDDRRDSARRDGRDGRYDRRDSTRRYPDGNTCVDANRDGRCDYLPGGTNGGGNTGNTNGYPASLPEMISTVILDRGQGSAEQTRWLGTQQVIPRYTDVDRNQVPERITWRNSRNQLVQIWIDANRDGRADAVQLFKNGILVTTRR